MLSFAALASLAFAAAHAPPGGSCSIERDGSVVTLASPDFAFVLDGADGLRLVRWEDRQSGAALSFRGARELEVVLGELSQSPNVPEWRVVAEPEPANGEALSADFELATLDGQLTARVHFEWTSRESLLVKSVRVANRSASELWLRDLSLGSYPTDAAIEQRGRGFPLYLDGSFFVALAHPAGWADALDGNVRLRQFPGRLLAPGATFDSMDAWYGVGARGAARANVVESLRRRTRRVVRGHDRPYAIYDNFGSWASGEFANQERYELASLALLEESQRATDCRFDLCNVHFWVDSAGDLKRWDPVRFPRGLAPIRAVLDRLGTAPGLWIGSSVTWGDSWSIGANPATRPSLTLDPAWFCRASEPIRSMFREAFVEHVRQDGVRLLKFDEFLDRCDNPAHAHLPGDYSTEAIDDSVIEFLRELDRASPELLILLYWGYRSPFWLLHADTLFDSGIGIEAATPSAQPTLYARDSVTQKLDQAERFAADVPPLGKDSLGVWLSSWGWNSSIGKERWQEGFAMDLCRGSLLAQIWADEHWLSPPEWRELADFIALLRAQPSSFARPRFILGDANRNEPYGYACSDGHRAVLAIDNCCWSDRTVALELGPSSGLPTDRRWELYRCYPRPAKLVGERADFGASASLALRPFEVELIEVVPAGERPSLTREWPIERSATAFDESSRELSLRATSIEPRADPVHWTKLVPTALHSSAGAEFTRLDDDSILMSGANGPNERTTLRAAPGVATLRALELELLPDARLPASGPGRAPNGNFALTHFAARLIAHDGTAQAIRFAHAAASYEQTSFGGWPIAAALDDVEHSGWSIDPFEGRAHRARFELSEPLECASGSQLEIELDQHGPPEHALGRFRLSATGDAAPLPPLEPTDVRRFQLDTELAATAHGGWVAISAEFSRGGARFELRDIGSYFRAKVELDAAPARATPVLGTATYPSSWQAWRIPVESSTAARAVRLTLDARLPSDVALAFRAHFVP